MNEPMNVQRSRERKTDRQMERQLHMGYRKSHAVWAGVNVDTQTNPDMKTDTLMNRTCP